MSYEDEQRLLVDQWYAARQAAEQAVAEHCAAGDRATTAIGEERAALTKIKGLGMNIPVRVFKLSDDKVVIFRWSPHEDPTREGRAHQRQHRATVVTAYFYAAQTIALMWLSIVHWKKGNRAKAILFAVCAAVSVLLVIMNIRLKITT